MEIKVVIGASYGDEGKGFMTDYFCKNSNKKCLTILHNGGSQRGHTVISEDGHRHVFHHLSSATFSGSDTYFAESFIINPLVFAQEHKELNPTTKIFCSPYCKWSTPFDMMLNQIIEDSRGDKRHGSCGYGIWETIVRYKNTTTVDFVEFMRMKDADKVKYLENIRDKYIPERLKKMCIEIPSEWEEILNDNGIIGHFIDDCRYFKKAVEFLWKNSECEYPYQYYNFSDDRFLSHEKYECMIFEGGQGLLLSQNEANPHTTPSYTGAENPVRMIKTIDGEKNIEVCYVTRSYLTRHGAGDFPQECTKAEINPDMIDETNVPNDYQGAIRYGKIDVPELRQRITDDFAKFSIFENAVVSVAVTHLNETDGKIITVDGADNPEKIGIEKIYKFYSEIN